MGSTPNADELKFGSYTSNTISILSETETEFCTFYQKQFIIQKLMHNIKYTCNYHLQQLYETLIDMVEVSIYTQ